MNQPLTTERTRRVWYFTARGNDYPLAFFTSHRKVWDEIERRVHINKRIAASDFEIHSQEIR